MAHFTLLRANQGLWVGVVTQAEFWAFDQGRFKSINGDDGGTWNPAAPIIIGGAGLQIAGGITFSGGGTITDPVIEGTLTVNDDAVIGEDATDDLDVNATTDFNSPVTFHDDVTLGDAAADDITVNGTTDFQGPVTVTGDFVLPTNGNDANIGRPLTTSALTVTGDLTVGNLGETGTTIVIGGGSDAMTVGADVEFTGTTEFSGAVTLNAGADIDGAISIADAVTLTTGHIRQRVVFITADMDLSVATCDVAIQRYGVVEGFTVDLLATGAADGDTITVINESRTYEVTVLNDGTEIGGVKYSFTLQDYAKSVYMYVAVDGGWRVVERYGSVSAT